MGARAGTCCSRGGVRARNRLDLSQYQPDFVALSFYKIFGYPTGIGAALARRDRLGKLHRPWFAESVTIATVNPNRHFQRLRASRTARLIT
ncbi:MAG: aminotransferase class V-fold PLP-dependent enzyme [Anaerolineae bacterium]